MLLLVGCGFRPTAAQPGIDAFPEDAPDARPDARPIDAPPDAAIPITFVQVATKKSASSSTTTVAATLTGPTTAGDLLVVVISWAAGPTTTAMADTAGNTFTPVGTGTSSNISQAVFYAPDIVASPASNVVTATFGTNENGPTIRVVEYSGVAASPFDAAATMTGTGTTGSASTTTSHAHDLIYLAETSDQVATGPGSGYTMRTIFDGDEVEDREVETAGDTTGDVPLDVTATWVATIVAFMGAS